MPCFIFVLIIFKDVFGLLLLGKVYSHSAKLCDSSLYSCCVSWLKYDFLSFFLLFFFFFLVLFCQGSLAISTDFHNFFRLTILGLFTATKHQGLAYFLSSAGV